MRNHRHGFGVFSLPLGMLYAGEEGAGGAAAAPAPAVTPPAAPPAAAAPAPAVAAAIAAAAPAPAATPAATPAVMPPEEEHIAPTALKARLERERKVQLKQLGFESEEEAKAAAQASRQAAEAKKSAEQKALEAQQLATNLQKRADSLQTLLNDQAADAFSTLTEPQKAAVRMLAADDADAEDRLKAIRAVRKLSEGQASATTAAATQTTQVAPATTAPAATAPAATTTTPVAAPAAAPPATTAPGATAPPSATTSPIDHRAEYLRQREKNPFAAAEYGLSHRGDVFKDQA